MKFITTRIQNCLGSLKRQKKKQRKIAFLGGFIITCKEKMASLV